MTLSTKKGEKVEKANATMEGELMIVQFSNDGEVGEEETTKSVNEIKSGWVDCIVVDDEGEILRI